MNPPASEQLQTFHAPPERLPPDEILGQSSALGNLSGLADLLDCMPDFVMILNEQRQMIFGNRALSDFAGDRVGGQLRGLRPGELLDCRHAGLAPPGRGIGTYRIRLLTERHLGGQVTLSSEPETGTRFELSFPKKESAGASTGVAFAHREQA